jgi:hypothetical protein
MLIKVMYQNNRLDLINGELLDQLLAENRIKQFYRYSEGKWVMVGNDPIRMSKNIYYGPERRMPALRKMNL